MNDFYHIESNFVVGAGGVDDGDASPPANILDGWHLSVFLSGLDCKCAAAIIYLRREPNRHT
jgi:hypothetical protein